MWGCKRGFLVMGTWIRNPLGGGHGLNCWLIWANHQVNLNRCYVYRYLNSAQFYSLLFHVNFQLSQNNRICGQK